VLVSWFIGAQSEGFLAAVVPLVSGAFIYIAASDLIPELRKENGVSSSTKQLLALTVGILIMYGLTLVELVA
jgi:zinc and cadmium transporter